MRLLLLLCICLAGSASSRTIQNEKIQRSIALITRISSMVLMEFGCELDYESKDFNKTISDAWWSKVKEDKNEIFFQPKNPALGFKLVKEVLLRSKF